MAKIPKEQWDKVMDSVELLSVTPRKICAERKGSLEAINESERGVDVNLTGQHSIHKAGKGLLVNVEFVAKFSNDGDEFECEVEYELLYGFDPPVTEDLLDAVDRFAQVNGVFNAWSYFRSTLQTIATSLGINGMTLPLYKPKDIKVADKDTSGEAKKTTTKKTTGEKRTSKTAGKKKKANPGKKAVTG